MAPTTSKPKGARPPRDTAPVTNDPRFSVIHSDPRFAPPKKQDTTLTIDARFSSALSDPRFSSKARVDRYGRKVAARSAKAELSLLLSPTTPSPRAGSKRRVPASTASSSPDTSGGPAASSPDSRL